MLGFDAANRPVPQFGDIVMLAMGRLERNTEDGHFQFVQSKRMCDEEDQIDVDCLKLMPRNVSALWSVQKVRHRDEKRNYRFELRFGIIPMVPYWRSYRMAKESPRDFKLRHFVLKQEDYPMYFNGQLNGNDLKKRTDFFEDAMPSVGHLLDNLNNEHQKTSSIDDSEDYGGQQYGGSIDRTLFDLMPFFEEQRAPQRYYSRYPGGAGSYTGGQSIGGAYRQLSSFGRPLASGSEYYNFYAHPPSRPLKKPYSAAAYGAYAQSPSIGSYFNPIAQSSYVSPVVQYKTPSFVRFPESPSASVPFKALASPINYHYTGLHPNQVQSPSVYQAPLGPITANNYQAFHVGGADFNSLTMANYFANRNRIPTVRPNYYARPTFLDYKVGEHSLPPKHQQPKTVYYNNIPSASWDVKFNGAGLRVQNPLWKDTYNGYSIQTQHQNPFVPLPHSGPFLSSQQQQQPLAQQSQQHIALATQPYIHTSAPYPPNYNQLPSSLHAGPSSHHQQPIGGGASPSLFYHQMQLVTPSGLQQQSNNPFQPQIISQLSIPLQATRMTSTFRFPPSIPLHNAAVQQQQPSNPSTVLPSIPVYSANNAVAAKPTSYSKDIFQNVREAKKNSIKFSEPDPLYHTTPTAFTAAAKSQATPKISYYFAKDDESSEFKPIVYQSNQSPSLSSSARRNYTKALELGSGHRVNYVLNHVTGGVVYGPASTPPTNIIYGHVEGKVQPPTSIPDIPAEILKSQLPAPTHKNNHQHHHQKQQQQLKKYPTEPSTTATPKTTSTRSQSTPSKRVTFVSSTPFNLITPPSPTTASRPVSSSSSSSNSITSTTSTAVSSSSTSSTTTILPSPSSPSSTSSTTTTSSPAVIINHRPYTPRGRQYQRSKVVTTSTEKPVLKWMPKRKRPKQQQHQEAAGTPKISATLSNLGGSQPHISNRTRVSKQSFSSSNLDDVHMAEESQHVIRRYEKLVQLTTTMSPIGDLVVMDQHQQHINSRQHVQRSKKRKNPHNYPNFVTVPTTSRPATSQQHSEESIPEPQKNVFTTTATSTPTITPSPPTLASRSGSTTTSTTTARTTEAIYERVAAAPSTFAPFLPTILPPTHSSAAPVVLELAKAEVKKIETDTPDVKLFRASNYEDQDDVFGRLMEEDKHKMDEADEEENEEQEHETADDHEEEEEEEEDGLDLLAKTIVAHAKKVFSDASDNTLTQSEGGDDDDENADEKVKREHLHADD